MGYTAGAVLLHRKLIEWQWYRDIRVKTVFLHLLLLANWKSKLYRKLEIKRGQLLTSYGHLAEEVGLTVKQVRGAMDKLRQTGEIKTVRAESGLLVSIVNYNSYQCVLGDRKNLAGRERAGEGQLLKKDNKKNKASYREQAIPEDLREIFCPGRLGEATV